MNKILNKIYEGEVFTETYDEERSWLAQKDSLYGEIKREGVEKIIEVLKELDRFNEVYLYDIGCGNGRAVLHFGLYEEVKKSAGIDLYKSKINFCKKIMIDSDYPNFNKLDIQFGDIFDVENLEEYNTIILNNVAWSDETIDDCLSKIKKGSTLITTVSLRENSRKSIKKLTKFKAWYTWNVELPGHCYIYEKI